MSKIYYHYCKKDTFISMLESSSLWLTDLTKSNDAEEIIHTYDILWKKIKRLLLDSDLNKQILESQIEMLDYALPCQIFSDGLLENSFGVPYGCCFSMENDLVHQWNEYAEYGSGVVVGFDLEWFGIRNALPTTSTNLINAIGYENVYYDLPGYDQEFASLFYKSIKKYGTQAWIMEILPTLKRYSGFIKNKSFKYEREVRIVYYPEMIGSGCLDILSGLIENPKPHYCLKWKKTDGHAMRTIKIGKQCSFTENDIIKMLQKAGISGVSISHSECSYRQRK